MSMETDDIIKQKWYILLPNGVAVAGGEIGCKRIEPEMVSNVHVV